MAACLFLRAIPKTQPRDDRNQANVQNATRESIGRGSLFRHACGIQLPQPSTPEWVPSTIEYTVYRRRTASCSANNFNFSLCVVRASTTTLQIRRLMLLETHDLRKRRCPPPASRIRTARGALCMPPSANRQKRSNRVHPPSTSRAPTKPKLNQCLHVPTEELLVHSRDYARAVPVANADPLHAERFAASCLPVGEDGGVEAFNGAFSVKVGGVS